MTSNKDIIKALKEQYRAIKIDQASIERNRAKLLADYQEKFPSTKKDLFFYFKPAFITAVVLFFFVLSSGGLVVYAQKSLPGSTFYAVKRIYEKVVFTLTPASQKTVLRAEMVAKRFNEVKDLVGQNGEKIHPIFIQEATHNLEKEIAALKKELKDGEKSNLNLVFELPVLDNKKIVEALKNQEIDLDKILTETKEAIQDKNLQMAMDKISEVEKIFSEMIIEEEGKNTEESTENSNEMGAENTIPLESETSTSPVISQPIVPVQPTPTDFKVDVNFEKETSIQK